MKDCQHKDKTAISIEVDGGCIMLIDSHCNDCHDTIRDRDRSHAAFIPYVDYRNSMVFDREHLGSAADLKKAAVDFIAQIKERKAV